MGGWERGVPAGAVAKGGFAALLEGLGVTSPSAAAGKPSTSSDAASLLSRTGVDGCADSVEVVLGVLSIGTKDEGAVEEAIAEPFRIGLGDGRVPPRPLLLLDGLSSPLPVKLSVSAVFAKTGFVPVACAAPIPPQPQTKPPSQLPDTLGPPRALPRPTSTLWTPVPSHSVAVATGATEGNGTR